MRVKIKDPQILQSVGMSDLYYDFCVIWDEDHDERVCDVIDQLCQTGLIFNFDFVGERKGCLTALVRPDMVKQNGVPWVIKLEQKLATFTDRVGDENCWDSWGCNVSWLGEHDDGLIYDSDKPAVTEYLRSIKSRWQLGVKTLAMIPA